MHRYFINTLLWIYCFTARINTSVGKMLVCGVLLLCCIKGFININEIQKIEFSIDNLEFFDCNLNRAIGSTNIYLSSNRGLLFQSDSLIPSFRYNSTLQLQDSISKSNIDIKKYLQIRIKENISQYLNEEVCDSAAGFGYLTFTETFPVRKNLKNVRRFEKIFSQDSSMYSLYWGETGENKKDGVCQISSKNIHIIHNKIFDNENYHSVTIKQYMIDSKHSVYPSFFDAWDISQKVYRLKLPTIGFSEVSSLKFDCVGPVKFSDMYPVPDKVTMSSIQFTDKEKIDQIRCYGLNVHVQFEQLKNIQSIRTFIVTSAITLFSTLFIKHLYRLFKMLFLKCIAKYKIDLDK